jgi:hypothetical protein
MLQIAVPPASGAADVHGAGEDVPVGVGDGVGDGDALGDGAGPASSDRQPRSVHPTNVSSEES